MPDETELHQAEAACLFQAKWFSTKPTIEALNGTQLEGRTLIVNEGHPQERTATQLRVRPSYISVFSVFLSQGIVLSDVSTSLSLANSPA